MKKTNRSGIEVDVTKKIMKQKKSTFTQMVNELLEEVATYSMHIYNANWKGASLKDLNMAIPDQSMFQILISQNIFCDFQDEILSAHLQHQQAKVHPTVCYCKCHECDENIKESLVFISDDGKHDLHAVHTYSSIDHHHFSQIRGLDINCYIQYTDGCSSQYKSRHAFIYIWCASKDFGCTIQRNYFLTHHGKGAADGESAVVKSSSRNAVKSSRHIISNAEELFTNCMGNLTRPVSDDCSSQFWRTFFWILKGRCGQKLSEKHWP